MAASNSFSVNKYGRSDVLLSPKPGDYLPTGVKGERTLSVVARSMYRAPEHALDVVATVKSLNLLQLNLLKSLRYRGADAQIPTFNNRKNPVLLTKLLWELLVEGLASNESSYIKFVFSPGSKTS